MELEGEPDAREDQPDLAAWNHPEADRHTAQPGAERAERTGLEHAGGNADARRTCLVWERVCEASWWERLL